MKKRKDGLYQEEVSFMQGGRRVRKVFYGKTKAELNRKIMAFREEQERGKLFSEVADEWWDIHEPTLAYNTTKGYKPALARAKQRFGQTYINRIKAPDVNRFLVDFIRDNHAAQKTAKTQLMVINLICKYATSVGYIPFNPARDISVPRGLSHTPRDIASDDDIRRIKACTDLPFGMFPYWVLYTGCRKGELLALRWEDIDIKRRTIHIHQSLYHIANVPALKDPKSTAGNRTVPLLDKLMERITPQKHGLIFPNASGELMSETQYKRCWEDYCRESGVSSTPHQIRHAYATMLYEAGLSVKDAQDLLGHAYASTTQDVYTHIRQSRKETVHQQLLGVDF